MKKNNNELEKLFLETRTIIISSVINADSAEKIISRLFLLEKYDAQKEIQIFVNSPGGEVSSGFAIYDTINFINNPVSMIVSGLAASMGSLILNAADKGRCFMLPSAKIMIHQPLLMEAQASVTDLQITAAEIEKTKQHIAQIYATKTQKNIKTIIKDMDRDKWFTADEALKYKLVDRIVKSRADIPPLGDEKH